MALNHLVNCEKEDKLLTELLEFLVDKNDNSNKEISYYTFNIPPGNTKFECFANTNLFILKTKLKKKDVKLLFVLIHHILEYRGAEFLSKKIFTKTDNEKLFEFDDLDLWYKTLLDLSKNANIEKHSSKPEVKLKFKSDTYQKQVIASPKDISFKNELLQQK